MGAYRGDITYEDFQIAKAFKFLFISRSNLGKGIPGNEHRQIMFKVIEGAFSKKKPVLIPSWYEAVRGWQLDRYKETTGKFYLLTVKDFRWICRNMQINTEPNAKKGTSEVKVIKALDKFGFLGRDKDNNLRWDLLDGRYYVLTMTKLCPEGKIGRVPIEPSARSRPWHGYVRDSKLARRAAKIID